MECRPVRKGRTLNLTLQDKAFELDLACTIPTGDFDSFRVRAAMSVCLDTPEGDSPAGNRGIVRMES